MLVVDDSLTVRELERKLLVNRGYEVAVAVDGMDGWNMLRSDAFDLVVTDVTCRAWTASNWFPVSRLTRVCKACR